MANRRFEAIALFLVLFFAAAFFRFPVDYDNTQARFFMVSAVVDHGHLHIDPYRHLTIDLSAHDDHFYANKAIGAPLLGVPVYWVISRLTTPPAPLPFWPVGKYLVRLVTTTLPFALLGVGIWLFAMRMGADPNTAFWSALAYGLGSIALIHAGMFSGHQLAACGMFFAMALIWPHDGTPASPWTHGLAGCCMGIAALADFTAMFAALTGVVYVLASRSPARSKLSFLAGGLPALAALGIYNQICFGAPWSFAYDHLVHASFKEGAASGLWGIALPDPNALWRLLASPARGLLFISPVLIFAVDGLSRLWRDHRRETIAMAIIVIGYFWINAGFYAWHGGWTFGPRYLVPVLPFLFFPMAFARIPRWLFFPLLAISLVQVGSTMIGHPHCPEDIANPLVEVVWPGIETGYRSTAAISGFHVAAPWVAAVWVGGIVIALVALSIRTPLPPARYRPIWVVLTVALAIAIAAGLTITRTADPATVHAYRARLYQHAYRATGQPALNDAAATEQLAKINAEIDKELQRP